MTDKSDPYAFQAEKRPGSASIVCDLGRYSLGRCRLDGQAAELRRRASKPIAIYELHLGSWRRKPEEGHRWLSYQEHADELVGYVDDMGFTHIELMPVSEFDCDASVGYQPLALYAPTSRWGTPEQFRLLVDRCHQAGIGVIADWVPNHFSDDPHGLANFDGTHLYEHPDPRQRRHPGSDTLTYDYGRREVANFLTANALFWLDKYHLDGLRIPAVETMLYLDYGRARGEWSPNRFGGHENLEAVDFLRRLNEQVYARYPGTFTIAEENSLWQRVSHPTFVGGLGFGFRWNTAWVRDTLRYLSRNPGAPQVLSRRTAAGSGRGLSGELRPAAVAFRSIDRQGLAAAQDAGRPLAALRQPADLLCADVHAPRQEAAVHGRRVRAGAGVELRHQSRLARAG